MSDSGNDSLANAEFQRQHWAGNSITVIKTIYFRCLGFCQFNILYALTVVGSTLFGAISHVVGLSSNKQVVGANTIPTVTVMKNPKPFWNLSKVKLIRKTMWQAPSRIVVEVTVAVLPLRPKPQPAVSNFRFVRRYGTVLVNFLPEFLFRGHTSKTPADPEVKSASECGNRDSGYKVDWFTTFSATSRPHQSYQPA